MAEKKERDYSNSGADATFLSDEDYEAVQGYKADYDAYRAAGNTSGAQAAHDAAEAVRAKYGYSGGADGSGYTKTPETKTFTYANYTDKYADALDQLTGTYLNRDAFTYDYAQDPIYQAYADQYTRLGQQAMEDTLGQISARTGGLASSYAGSAAQQSYNSYMQALSDKIPELWQTAYSMYQDEGDRQLQNISLLQSLSDSDYSRYNTDRGFAYGQYADDRAYGYQAGRDAVADARYEDETAYNRGIYADETAYNRGLYADETAYNRARQNAQDLVNGMGDYSGYEALGWTADQIRAAERRYQSDLAGSSSGASGRASSGAASGSTSGEDGSASRWDAVDNYVSMYGEDAAEDYIKENYKDLGYSNQSSALSGWNNHLRETAAETEKTVDYGSAFESVALGAVNLWDNNYSVPQIESYLKSRVDAGVLTQAGYDYLMEKIKEGA